jgi:hypothetical protein
MQPYQAGPTAFDHEVAQGLELVLGKVAHSVPHDLDFGDGLFGTVAVLANCQREVVVLVAAHTGQGGSTTAALHTTTGSRRPIAKWTETAIEGVFVADVGWRSRCSSRRPTGTRSGACS